MTRVKVYISGPITGIDPEVCRTRFEKAEDELKQQGFIPVNPLKNGLPDTATYDEHMKRDLEMLADCGIIYMLNGWERSNGCRIEFNTAITAKKPILFEKEEQLYGME